MKHREPIAFEQMISYVVDPRVKTGYSIKARVYQIVNFISYIFYIIFLALSFPIIPVLPSTAQAFHLGYPRTDFARGSDIFHPPSLAALDVTHSRQPDPRAQQGSDQRWK